MYTAPQYVTVFFISSLPTKLQDSQQNTKLICEQSFIHSFPHKIRTILGYFDFWIFGATAAWAAFLAFTISTNSCKENQTHEIILGPSRQQRP
jgi:hypothetical protein